MSEIKLNLRPNLSHLFRYLSAIILNYLNQFRKRSNEVFIITIGLYEPNQVHLNV
ncbi:replicative DNA helicase domain protein [Orientia tsutsugamushi str. Karp]|nr:replicative DNA helicase domain protein [Orientia tsutsugamushi str. Karp]